MLAQKREDQSRGADGRRRVSSKSILRFGPYEDPGDYSGWPRGVLQLRSAWEKEAETEIAESGEDRGSHCVGSDRRALLELRART